MPNEEVMITQIDSNLFEIFWNQYGSNINLNKDFIKKVFIQVDLKYKNLISDASVKDVLNKNVGIYDMVNYICAEHRFHLALVKPETRSKLEKDEKYFNQLVSICYEKLFVNEYREVESRAVITKYSVEISVLEMYINHLFYLLPQLPLSQTSAKQKLLADIYAKCFMLIKSTLNQLTEGLETEALSSWRTFHELFCVLCVITKGDEKVSQAYFRHLQYGAYSRGEIEDEALKEQIQKSMEKDMLDLAVKKANKEKFINYGWIHWAFKEYNGEEVKMNFLGGLQKVADMTEYKKYYELSSDVTHSTPLLVYANKVRLTTTTLFVTYKSFFKIESMFLDFIIKEVKVDRNYKPLHDYLNFRKIYTPKLLIIYKYIESREESKK